MKVLGIQTSPNEDGLTASMAFAALEGAESAGAETEIIHLRQLDVGACLACGDGWGICRSEHTCVIADDFHTVRAKMGEADAIVISTPVYFGEPSEVTKSLLDRLRRCEFPMGDESPLYGTPAVVISAAGGSGGGVVTTLEDMERYLRVMAMRPFDLVTVTRFSRDHKIETARAAGARLVAFAINGE